MTVLILVRHGNTFGPEDKVVWAGARTDLPLVKKGREQADQIGKMLAASGLKPNRLLTGPLIRTRQHAQTIARHIWFSGDIEIAAPLCEIDYGTWEGLSTVEIHALGGEDELAAWNSEASWPQTPDWTPSEGEVKAVSAELLFSLAKDAATEHAILVTSNGILRFIARQCVNPPTPSELKVNTGNYCVLKFENGDWHQTGWNLSPYTPFTPD